MVLVTRDREGEGRWAAGIGEERREKVVDLVGDSVELVTQAVTQGQIRNNLVGILDEGIELLLTEAARILISSEVPLTTTRRSGGCSTNPASSVAIVFCPTG